ncbi:MAG: glycosyltransferase family 1 protein [Bryobacterales bacterium]|nr:glycosyltransferase family 1 protein [Bryobacterales bacterium]
MNGSFTFVRREPAGAAVARYLGDRLDLPSDRFLVSGDIAANVPGKDGVLWLHGNAAFFPKVCRSLMRTPVDRRPLVVIWHMEPLPPPAASGIPKPMLHLREIAKIVLRDPRATDVYTNWFTLQRLHRNRLPDVLFVSAPGRREFLAERGIESHFVPVGYLPEMGRDLHSERDIDVLFLGSLDVPRRNRILKSLRKQGVSLAAYGDWKNPAYWGESRTVLVNRAKILLNLPRTAGEYSGIRILLGLANKSLVVSEPIYDPHPYIPGTHFVMGALEEIPGLISRYLEDDAARMEIVDAGYRAALNEFSMERSLQRILEIVAANPREGGNLVRTALNSGRAEVRA